MIQTYATLNVWIEYAAPHRRGITNGERTSFGTLKRRVDDEWTGICKGLEKDEWTTEEVIYVSDSHVKLRGNKVSAAFQSSLHLILWSGP